ncbi:PspA/IM30 family protein [Oscillatoria sp. FACHB-1406]|uniref:PspA/IM30 family protein n=1 Tax=Oscillatoria sp. FACHB-1406 TaxID=2692846 RepID=UPI001684F230|nr:PspA/IM30 family protein [Oscillatoria sp. FACHB-1406]MBD2578610.1 PspA/IM30 family protein [Oscillatoria sp. FACHB-1406]
MGLFDRTLQNRRANASRSSAANSDPEGELGETLRAMQEELLLLRQAVASAIALQKRTERQKLQEEAVAEGLQRRAKEALSRGDEISARAALTQRQPHLKNARTLQAQIERDSETILQMRANLRHLEQKLSEALTKQQMYVARARSAEATRRLYEL